MKLRKQKAPVTEEMEHTTVFAEYEGIAWWQECQVRSKGTLVISVNAEKNVVALLYG